MSTRTRSTSLLLLVIASLSINSFSQEIDFENSNWLKEIRSQDDYMSRFDLSRYTKVDVRRAKQRYLEIVANGARNEWQGVYSRSTAVGFTEFHWNTRGYVSFYVYHTLGALDFGSVTEDADTVEFFSETEGSQKKRRLLDSRYVKVMYGDRRFLVPEKRLRDFLNRAVGRNTSLTDIGYYMEKTVDENAKAFGLPIVAAKYAGLVSTPLQTKISRVGKRVVHQNRFPDGTVNYVEVYRFVELPLGSRGGVAVGMNLFVDDLGEWLEIVSVFPDHATARIRRDLDDGKESCWDSEQGQGESIPCRIPRAGMQARTRMSALYF